MAAISIGYRRIYEDPSSDDGLRVLVDRIWPRGVRKGDVHLDDWLHDVAPSNELRRWYAHDLERFAEFRRRYLAELRDPVRQLAVRRLRQAADHHKLTLLTAAHDLEHSQAAVLADCLNRQHSPRKESEQ